MKPVPMWRRYLRFFGPDVPADVSDEISFHLASRTEELIAHGVRPDEARKQAAAQFGDVADFAGECERIDREQLRRRSFSQGAADWGNDLRVAVRGVTRSPKFSLAVIGTLAAGIGGAAFLFSTFDSWVLRSVRFPEPDRLMYATSFDKARGRDTTVSWPDFQDLRTRAAALESLAAWRNTMFTVNLDGVPERVASGVVTAEFLSTLRVKPRTGRLFTSDDFAPGRSHVALASYWYWKNRLGGRPVSELTPEIDGAKWAIIGVLPEDFHFTLLGSPDLLAPIVPTAETSTRRDLRAFELVGRLRAGATADVARQQLRAVADDLARTDAQTNSGIGVTFHSLADEIGKHTGEQVLVIVLAVTLGLFLIACSNVGNLLLVRAVSRRRHAAIQISMGAAPGRLVRQALMETGILFVAGGLAGALIGAQLNPLLANALPVNSRYYLPGHGEIEMNWPVFLVILALAAVSALLFGAGPAMETARANVATELKDAGTAVSQTRKAKRLRLVLASAQIFLALTLGSSTVALIDSFHTAWAAPLGFDEKQLLTFHIAPDLKRYADETRRRQFYDAVVNAVAGAAPGAQVTLAESIPFPDNYGGTRFRAEGQTETNLRRLPRAGFNVVAPGFFSVMRIGGAGGRMFAATDDAAAPLRAIVNEALANQYFAGRAVGRRIYLSALSNREAEIVGVVREIRVSSDPHPDAPQVYVPLAQAAPRSTGVIVRAPRGQDPLASVPAVRQSLSRLDPLQPIYEVRTMEDRLTEAFAPYQLVAVMLGVAGMLALALAALGVYGVVAFSVSQRTREIGILAALGANRSRLLRLFMGQGARLLAYGLGPGLAASIAAIIGLRSALGEFGAVSMGVPVTMAVVVLAAAVALATLGPAWRAGNTDPLTAIRHE